MDGFKRLVSITFLLALVVIALGAYTRLTEAGLGCPDWPGCYGFAGVPETAADQQLAQVRFPDAPIDLARAWNEMIHRYVAGTLGLLILAINIMAWRQPGLPRRLPAMLLVLVVFQAVLGMWTVTMALMPVVVMGHLLGGFTTASLLLLLRLRLAPRSVPSMLSASAPGKGLQLLAALGLVIVVGQVALGGWTAANYAAVVCTQLPFCEVDWQQQFDVTAFRLIQPEHDSYQYGVLDYAQRVSIHVAHRIGAVVTVAVLLLLAAGLWRRPSLRRWSVALVAVLGLQVALGITNVVASLPLAVAVAHNVTGLALVLLLVAANYQLYRMGSRWSLRASWPRPVGTIGRRG